MTDTGFPFRVTISGSRFVVLIVDKLTSLSLGVKKLVRKRRQAGSLVSLAGPNDYRPGRARNCHLRALFGKAIPGASIDQLRCCRALRIHQAGDSDCVRLAQWRTSSRRNRFIYAAKDWIG